MSNLMKLNDEEYADELRESLFDHDLWSEFVEPDVADRTRAVLVMLASSIRGQLAKYEEGADRQWVVRARNMLRSVNGRLAEVKASIKARNRAETASTEAYERKWSSLAFTLADILENSDMAFMLDEINVDGGNPIPVREWLKLRRDQKLAKGIDPGTGVRFLS